MDAGEWCDLVKEFGRTFKRAVGTAEGNGRIRKRIGLGAIPRVALQLGDTVVVGTENKVLAFSIRDAWHER